MVSFNFWKANLLGWSVSGDTYDWLYACVHACAHVCVCVKETETTAVDLDYPGSLKLKKILVRMRRGYGY